MDRIAFLSVKPAHYLQGATDSKWNDPMSLAMKVSETKASVGSTHTSAEVHENENFPYVATAYIVDTRINVAHNVLVPWEVPLWTRMKKYIVSYRHSRGRISQLTSLAQTI